MKYIFVLIEGEHSLKDYLYSIKVPISLIVINFLIANFYYALLPVKYGEPLFNAGRMVVIIFAGWFVITRDIGNLWRAALSGTTLYFIDHVVLRGGIFLVAYLFNTDGPGLKAFGRVLVTFVIFSPLTMLLGFAGGLLGKWKNKRL